MNLETPHPLPGGRTILPSVAWEATKHALGGDAAAHAKRDIVLLVSYVETLEKINTRCSQQNASETAIEIIRCGLAYRAVQLHKLAEQQGLQNLIDGLYAAAIGGNA